MFLPSTKRRAELPFSKIKQTALENLSWLTSESEVLVQDSAELQEAAVKWHKNIQNSISVSFFCHAFLFMILAAELCVRFFKSVVCK